MKLEVEIPEELKELESASPINWQLVLERRLREELEELARLARILAKSKLSEEQANSLSDEVSLSLAKRYERLLKEK